MKISAKDLANTLNGELIPADTDLSITGAQGLSEAGAGDVSFISNPKYNDIAFKTNAGLLLVSDSKPKYKCPIIRVPNPQLAYSKILWVLNKERTPKPVPGIHKTAIVAESAKVAEDACIGPFAVIEEKAEICSGSQIDAHCYIGHESRIGADCHLYPSVTVRENTLIGRRVIIHPGAVIGADGFGFVFDGKMHSKIPQIGSVEIGDDVEIGANTTIDRGTTGRTVIGKGTKIDNLVMIAHNVRIGENCIIVAQAGLAGSSKIGNFVTMAAQTGIAGHLEIGDGAIIAARSGVIGDIKPKSVVSGFPAKPHKEEMRLQAIIHKLPEIYKKLIKQGNQHG